MIRTILFWFTMLGPVVVFALTYWQRSEIAVNSEILANVRTANERLPDDERQIARMLRGTRRDTARANWIADVMRVVVSLLVLLSGLYVILSGAYDGGSQKWAFGAVGSIVGYWLRGRSKV
jgi:hypothetical protein